jgi:hypothetical protein
MSSPGHALASAIELLVSDRQQSATNTRNSSFVGAGQKLLDTYGIDASSDKFRFLMTRFRGDGDEDLLHNTDILLSEYPELGSLEGVEGLTLALSKAARPANRAVSMERVRSSIVRSVVLSRGSHAKQDWSPTSIRTMPRKKQRNLGKGK